MPWDEVDAIYVFSRQDGSFTQIERNWKVDAMSANGTSLWTYDWPTGSGASPAVYLSASVTSQPPPPAPMTSPPPAVARLNTPCEQSGTARSALLLLGFLAA